MLTSKVLHAYIVRSDNCTLLYTIQSVLKDINEHLGAGVGFGISFTIACLFLIFMLLTLFIKHLALQRHFSVMTKFAHVESRLSGRKRQREVVFYAPINLCD